MTVARASQVVTEVIRTNTGVKARTAQVVVEVLRVNHGARMRTSQVAIEVLRPNADVIVSITARPQVFVCT